MQPPFHNILCTTQAYQVIVYMKQPCSQLNERVRVKSEIITYVYHQLQPTAIKSNWGGTFLRNVNINVKKRCYNTEDCNQTLSGLLNTGLYSKKIKHESRRQSHCNSLCPVFILYRQGEHWSALIQIYQVVTYYVESVQTISVLSC
jgi:hypothetical protein